MKSTSEIPLHGFILMYNLLTSAYKPFVAAFCYLLIQSDSLHFYFTEILLHFYKKFILFNREKQGYYERCA
jgi:hypothetical protein